MLWILLLFIIANANICNVNNLNEFIDASANQNCDEIRLINDISFSQDIHINTSNKTFLGNGYKLISLNLAKIYFYVENTNFKDINFNRNFGDSPSFLIFHSKNITIINYSHNFTFTSLLIFNSTDVKMKNMYNFYNSIWFVIDKSKDIFIEDWNMRYGGRIGNISNSYNIFINNSIFNKTNKYWVGGLLITNSKNITITNSKFLRSFKEVLTLNSVEDVNIKNVEIDDVKFEVIKLLNSNSVNINNLSISTFYKRGLYIVNTNVTVNNSNFLNFIKSAIFIDRRIYPSIVELSGNNFINYIKYMNYTCVVGDCRHG